MNSIIKEIRQELALMGNPKLVESSKRFFKEGESVGMHGINAAVLRKFSKEWFKKISHESKPTILAMCEEFWQAGMIEEDFLAGEWAYCQRKKYEPEDFGIFESWVFKYLTNWASCDNLCNHTIGTFIEMYPEYLSSLKNWTTSTNRWARRASAVSLIVPAKKGLFLDDIFEIATLLLNDQDDLVQKGYGWMLKAATKNHGEEVFNFVIRNKAIMPRTALRYAIEKLPESMKKEAISKI